MELRNKIINSDCIEGMKQLPAASVDCCVTSPPYFGLRDYGHEGQIGLEETPEMFVDKMVEVFEQVKRVLKPEGSLWLNLGDSYSGSGRGANENGKQGTNKGTIFNPSTSGKTYGLKPKDLIGIPWMVAFALRSAGWYLRQDIIWHKPNPMPESVTDRCTKSHEYIFLLSKSAKYYYDHEAIKQPLVRLWTETNGGNLSNKGVHKKNGAYLEDAKRSYPMPDENGANKRSVWTVTTKPFSEAHFATFPEDLIVDCIKAGCPEYVCNKCGKAREKIIETEIIRRERPNQFTSYRAINGQPDQTKQGVRTEVTGLTDCGCGAGFSPGVCLDPFMGAGTTALVARKLNRNYIGFELNQEYIKIAERRLYNNLGMFI
jgi:DNA modification methylase